MSAEIKRRAEIMLCIDLRALVPGHTFVPMKGGGDNSDPSEMEPPFTIITVTEANRVHPLMDVYQCSCVLQTITHTSENTVLVHAAMVDQINNALISLTPHRGDAIIFNGLDVTLTRSASDDDLELWVDVIEFQAGFTALM